MVIRPLTRDDVPAIHALEVEVYVPSLHESAESFVRLIEIYPDGAIGGFDEEGLCGYGFGVPLRAGTALELRSPLAAVPADADTFYIHDVAVAARCRGRGVGRILAGRLLDLARAEGFRQSELVSVQGSAPFWEKFGFREQHRFDYAPGTPSVKMTARW
jgi:GNAT superfamily N-acetyltransferase